MISIIINIKQWPGYEGPADANSNFLPSFSLPWLTLAPAHTGSQLTKHIMCLWCFKPNILITENLLFLLQLSRLLDMMTSNQPKSRLYFIPLPSTLSYVTSEKNVLLLSRCLNAVLCVYIFVSSNEAGNDVGSGGRWDVNKYYITQHVPPLLIPFTRARKSEWGKEGC